MEYSEQLNRYYYEKEDLVIGELYKRGKNNFLLLKFKEIKISENKYRTDCICRNTKTGQISSLVPSMFNVKIDTNSFNKTLQISDEDMSNIIIGIDEKNISEYKQFEIDFSNDEQDISIIIETLENKIRFELDIDGDCVAEKTTKIVDFYKKYTLKHNNLSYSFQFIE
jgi:hypothetical protein